MPRIVCIISKLNQHKTTMPLTESTTAVVVEPDEDYSMSFPNEEMCQDATVIEMANELLALSGKKGRVPTMTRQFQPLSRPQTFTPSYKAHLQTKKKKKRALSTAISDDEDDCRSAKRTCQQMTQVPRKFGGITSSTIPLGRPLAAPPRLPCLAPGQTVAPALSPFAPVSSNNKSSCLWK